MSGAVGSIPLNHLDGRVPAHPGRLVTSSAAACTVCLPACAPATAAASTMRGRKRILCSLPRLHCNSRCNRFDHSQLASVSSSDGRQARGGHWGRRGQRVYAGQRSAGRSRQSMARAPAQRAWRPGECSHREARTGTGGGAAGGGPRQGRRCVLTGPAGARLPPAARVSLHLRCAASRRNSTGR
jgi:hypothetical protein